MSRIVIALGGNALGNSPVEQKEIVKDSAKAICAIIKQGHEVIIAHGNGPQVGMINNAFDEANKVNSKSPFMPFAECGAMSQGYIGYHLQNAIVNEMRKQNIKKDVACVVTQVLVDKNDAAFNNPSKPIGAFYNELEAKQLAAKNNFTVKEDAGRGWRRVIASPKPIDIIEKDVIKNLVANNTLVIACGGGGIPVIENEGNLVGTAAVIDKDFASEKLAELVNADILLILTAVQKVAINYGKTDEKWLDKISYKQAQEYIDQNQFSAGSMLPKVQAAMLFVNKNDSRKAIIAELQSAGDALIGKNGTTITNN